MKEDPLRDTQFLAFLSQKHLDRPLIGRDLLGEFLIQKGKQTPQIGLCNILGSDSERNTVQEPLRDLI